MGMIIISAFFALIIGLAGGYFVKQILDKMRFNSAKQVAANILKQANDEAKSIKRDAEVDAKDLAQKYRHEVIESLSGREKRSKPKKVVCRTGQILWIKKTQL